MGAQPEELLFSPTSPLPFRYNWGPERQNDEAKGLLLDYGKTETGNQVLRVLSQDFFLLCQEVAQCHNFSTIRR